MFTPRGLYGNILSIYGNGNAIKYYKRGAENEI